MSYPEIFDDDFFKKLLSKKEFHYYDKSLYFNKRQQFIKNYINPNTPYDRIMLMYETGVGKTLSAIAITEEFKKLKKKNFLEKTVIITKNEDIQDIFIKEFSTKCCDYNVLEEGIFLKKNKEEFRNFKKRIRKNYDFMTFGSLTNKILGTKQLNGDREFIGEKITNLSNRVIIIDEFHNILGNEYYTAIQKVLDNSKNIRLVLLSATPFTDSIENLYQISNLLNEKKDHITKEKFNTLVYRERVDIVIKNEIVSLTKEGEDVFSEKLKGKVSYMGVDKRDFPKKVFKGEHIKGSNSIKIFKDIMSNSQTNVYNNIFTGEKNDPLFKNSSDVCVYSGKYEPGKTKQHSAKISSIINEIKKTNGIVFIYSNNVNNKGIKLVSKILNEYNISNVALSKDVSREDRKSIIKKFNSFKNRYGADIKVLLGSPVLSEGITLRNVRQIHVLEPYWNMGKIDQVSGRAIRRGSHSDLPENERIVDIFLHAAVTSEGKETIDIDKYILSYYKDIPIKKTERLLKKISIDCHFNPKHKGKDGSRDCDYQECRFDCSYQFEIPEMLDKSTFYKVIKVNKKITNEILKLFDKVHILSFKNIQEELQDLNKEGIARSLQDIIVSKIQTENGRSIIYKNGLYISSKRKVKDDENILIPEILFMEVFTQDTFENKSIADYNKTPFIEKEKQQKQIKKSGARFLKENIYGSFKDKFGIQDNNFRIVLNYKNNKNEEDKRELIKGKSCTSFSKQELAEILSKYLDFKVKNLRFTSKEEMCSTILNKLKDKNLIEE